MTALEISNVLNMRESWIKAGTFARVTFRDEMADLQYGGDELTQAWEWFITGWNKRASDTGFYNGRVTVADL